MKACSPGGGLDTPTFFFEGGDVAAHAQTMNAFFTSRGYVMRKNGPRSPTKSDFEAAVAGHGSRPKVDLIYKASDANVFASGSLGASKDGKYTMVNLRIYDCAQPPVDGMMAALCRP